MAHIYFTSYAWQKINAYIQQADGEISGLGQATHKNGVVLVTNVFIWAQECGGAHTHVDTTRGQQNGAIFDLVQELKKKKVPTGELCVWWHSHDTMNAFFSQQDKDTIENWLNDSFLVAVVGNKKGEFKGAVHVKQPFAAMLENVPVELYNPVEPSILKEVQTEIEKKVKEPAPPARLPAQTKWDRDMLTPVQRGSEMDMTQIEVESAQACACLECWDYLQGVRDTFSYKTHFWSKKRRRYIAINGHGVEREKVKTYKGRHAR